MNRISAYCCIYIIFQYTHFPQDAHREPNIYLRFTHRELNIIRIACALPQETHQKKTPNIIPEVHNVLLIIRIARALPQESHKKDLRKKKYFYLLISSLRSNGWAACETTGNLNFKSDGTLYTFNLYHFY